MCETQEVSNFMGRLFCQAINEIGIIGRVSIILILQPGGGDYCIPGGVPGEAEEVFVTCPAEILRDNKENRPFCAGSFFIEIERIEECSCIGLPSGRHITGHHEMALADAGCEGEECSKFPAERSLDAGGCSIIPKNKQVHLSLYLGMAGLKHIERCIAAYIAKNYQNVAEVGVGKNQDTALMLRDAGLAVFCTDTRPVPPLKKIRLIYDDIFSPEKGHYRGLDLIYSIRPHEEMIPPLIRLAEEVNCDLLVYHLGFEYFGDGGELIDCGVVLHRYCRSQNPPKSVF